MADVQLEASDFNVTSAYLGDDVYVVTVAGEFDIATAPSVREALRTAIEEGGREIVLDILGVAFIDSAALGMLVDVSKRLRARGGTLAVVCADRQLLRVFEITGLTRIFRMHASLREAVEPLGRPAVAEPARP